MTEQGRLIELALKGLEFELARVNAEIHELQSGTKRTTTRTTSSTPVLTRKRKGRLTAEGRKRLSESAKRRWALSKKKGKTTL